MLRCSPQVLDVVDGLRAHVSKMPVLQRYLEEAPPTYLNFREPLELLSLALQVSRCDPWRLDVEEATTLAARLGISVSHQSMTMVPRCGGRPRSPSSMC